MYRYVLQIALRAIPVSTLSMAFLMLHTMTIHRIRSTFVGCRLLTTTLLRPNASLYAQSNLLATRTHLYQTVVLTSHGWENAWAEATNTMSEIQINTPQAEKDITAMKAVNIIRLPQTLWQLLKVVNVRIDVR